MVARQEVVMKKLEFSGLIALAFLVAACSPVIYDGPHQTHSSFSVYHHQNVARGGHDMRHDRRKARIEQELYNRHLRAAHIYRGDGRMGQLIEVTVSSGRFYHKGKYWKYSPVTFRIAAGDIIRFPAADLDIDLFIRYQNGYLALDTDIFGSFSHSLLGISYRSDWVDGHSYHLDNAHFRDARVKVKALSPRKNHVKHHDLEKNRKKHVNHQGPSRADLVKHKEKHAFDQSRHDESQGRHDHYSKQKKEKKTFGEVLAERERLKDQAKVSSKQREREDRHATYDRNDRQNKSGNKKTYSREKPRVKVVFKGGSANVNGKRVALKKTSVILTEGQSKNVKIATRSGKKVELPVSYRDGNLYVDGRRDSDRQKFKVQKSGKKERIYEFSTSNKARIRDVEMIVNSL